MSVVNKVLVATMAAAVLAGCASTKEVQIKTVPVTKQVYQPAPPAEVKLTKIKFRVITKENLDAFITEEAKKQGNPNPVFVVISTKDYEALSLNLAELKRYMDQQKQIIVYYQNATSAK